MHFRSVRKPITIFAVLALVTVGIVFNARYDQALAQDREDLVAAQQASEEQISQLKSQLTGLDVNVQETFLQLEETKQKVVEAESELSDAEARLSLAEREAQKNASLLASAQDKLKQIQSEKEVAADVKESTLKSLGELARATYRGDVVPSSLELIMGTGSAEDFMNAYRANSVITRTQVNILDTQSRVNALAANREARQNAVEKVISGLKDEADEIVRTRTTAKNDAQVKRDDLNELKAEYEQYMEQLQGQKAEIEASILKHQEAQADINAKIAAIDAENRRKAAQQGSRNNAGNAGSVVVTSSDWIQTPLPKPLRITSPFAYRINPVSGRAEFHPAIDIGSPCGSVQRASADGTIAGFRSASDGNPYGNAVYVNHGMVEGSSWVTFHAHLSRIDVRIGQQVAKGEPIGLTGTTGWSTGCHLHYEVHRNGQAINPMSLPSFQ